SHIIETRTPPVVKLAPHARTKNPIARNARPNPIFAGVDGCFRPRRTQSAPKTGASRMMKIELTDCRNDAGISQPKITRWVIRSAKRFIDEPACSHPAQKRTAAMKNTKMTAIRFLSATGRWERKMTDPKIGRAHG